MSKAKKSSENLKNEALNTDKIKGGIVPPTTSNQRRRTHGSSTSAVNTSNEDQSSGGFNWLLEKYGNKS